MARESMTPDADQIQRELAKIKTVDDCHPSQLVTLIERLTARTDFTPVGERGCYLWQGGVSPRGYGQIAMPMTSRMLTAHRAVFFVTRGRMPDGDCCHACDVRLCCRPDHLWEGSRADNMADAAEKGRLGRWSPRARATAMRYLRWGFSVPEVSRGTGIPMYTINYWLSESPELRSEVA